MARRAMVMAGTSRWPLALVELVLLQVGVVLDAWLEVAARVAECRLSQGRVARSQVGMRRFVPARVAGARVATLLSAAATVQLAVMCAFRAVMLIFFTLQR